jgi:hypothetical protein
MNAVRRIFGPALAWQSRAVLARHLRVHLRNWHTALVPPLAEPLVMLLAFGVGLGAQSGTSRGAARRRTTCRISRRASSPTRCS